MKTNRAINIFLVIPLLLCVLKTVGQKNNCCNNFIVPSIEEVRETESGESYFPDSLKKNILLVFEKYFDDSIIIKLNDSIIYNSMLVTNQPNTPRAKFINVDYSIENKLPLILIKKANGDCISFYIKQGYRVAYINYSQQLKIWGIELSNILRQYI